MNALKDKPTEKPIKDFSDIEQSLITIQKEIEAKNKIIEQMKYEKTMMSEDINNIVLYLRREQHTLLFQINKSKTAIHQLEKDIQKITSAKFFKVWQFYKKFF